MRFISTAVFLALIVTACSHDYESDTLDLGFYQWNLWPDPEGVWEESFVGDSISNAAAELENIPMNPPSCGWEELHRGKGKLVRIPTDISEHFSAEGYTGVTWFHTRYTLPELWENKRVLLKFGSAGYRTEVYLNEKLTGFHEGSDTSFEVDITEQVFYTRDNHLSIRISGPEATGTGITGNLKLKVVEGDN